MKIKLDELKNKPEILENIHLDSAVFSDSFDNSFISDHKCDEEIILTFIIPSHNRYEMLKQTLKSIFIQDFKNYEIIVIDDNSTQEEYNSLNILPITYLKNTKSLGPGKTRQKGFLQSRGKYIIFIDDDDFYVTKNFISKGIKMLDENKNLAFVSYNTLVYYEKTKEILINKLNINGFLNNKDYFLNFVKKYQKPTSTFPTIFNKEMLVKADLNNMEMMNDASIYLRALTQGDAYIFSDFVGIYRVHETNISKAVPHDFILKTVEEKNKIYYMAKNKFNIDLKTWFKNQIEDTFRYYIIDGNCSFNNAVDFIKNTVRTTELSYFTLIKIYAKANLIKIKLKLFR